VSFVAPVCTYYGVGQKSDKVIEKIIVIVIVTLLVFEFSLSLDAL